MLDDREYQRVYQLARYHRRRAEALDVLGGKCAECGATEDLQIDHRDPATKSFDVAKSRPGLERWLAEIAKCQALCRPCHKNKSAAEQRTDVHGTWGMAKRCKCDECREFVNAYQREYKRKRRDAARSKACMPPSSIG